MSDKANLAVVATIAGEQKCFGGPYTEEEAQNFVEKLNGKTYLIRDGRTVPVFGIITLEPGKKMLWCDGLEREFTKGGEIRLLSSRRGGERAERG